MDAIYLLGVWNGMESVRTDVEYQYTIPSSSLCTICSLSRSVSMSIFDEGGTVGTLLNVIGLRWDLVRSAPRI
jgi:hypothetical protein